MRPTTACIIQEMMVDRIDYFLTRQGEGKPRPYNSFFLDKQGEGKPHPYNSFFLARQGEGKPHPYSIYFLRFAISSSVVPVVINSYNKAWPALGRRIRPRRWMYSRLVLLPLTIIA